jgi:hypothetical protein
MSANLFEGGTGCHMWDAGFLLAEWLLNHQELITGASFAHHDSLITGCICTT